MFIQEKITSKFIKIQNFLKPNISVEVGAHDADFSKLVTSLVSKSYAFEASSKVYEKFKDTMGEILYINKAVSDHNNTTKMNIDINFNEADAGHNGIKMVSSKNWSQERIQIDVECVSLNEYFKDEASENIVLWVDCEGANKEVLTGGDILLSRVSSIFIETETEELWQNSWLEEEVVEFLDRHSFKLVYKERAYESQNNCIFIKKDLVTNDILNILLETEESI